MSDLFFCQAGPVLRAARKGKLERSDLLETPVRDRSAATYAARRCEDVSLAATESIRRWIRCAGTPPFGASDEPGTSFRAAGSRFPLRS